MIKFLIIGLMLVYLLIQSVADIKMMKVYVFLNNIFLCASVLVYIAGHIVSKTAPYYVDFIVCIGIWLLHFLHQYGKGDAKAMTTMFLLSGIQFGTFPETSIFGFLIEIFVANVLFIIATIIKNLVTKEKKKRHAYFPYLTFGYLLGTLAFVTL